MAEQGVVDPATADPLDMSPSEPTVDLGNLPADPEVGGDEPEAKDTGNNKPDDGGKPKDEKWDKGRQQRDQNSASIKGLTDQVSGLVTALGESQGNLVSQVQEAIVAANKVAKAEDKPAPDEPDPLGDAIKAIEEMDAEDVGAEQLVGVVTDALSSMKNATPQSAALITALQKELKEAQDGQSKINERLDAREAQDLATAVKQRINSHLDALDRTHSPGKKTFRTKSVAAAQKACREMGFSSDNRPPESTMRMALTHSYSEVAYEAKDASRKANQPKVEGAATKPFTMDSMTGGVEGDGPKGKMGPLDEVMRDITSRDNE